MANGEAAIVASSCMVAFVFLLATAIIAYALQRPKNPLNAGSQNNSSKTFVDVMIALGVIGFLGGVGVIVFSLQGGGDGGGAPPTRLVAVPQ
jgi:hypothetical protein